MLCSVTAVLHKPNLLCIIDIRRDKGAVILDTGDWFGALATKLNDDGTTSLIVSEGAARGVVDLVVGRTDGKRTLNLITAQHKYIFTEVQ